MCTDLFSHVFSEELMQGSRPMTFQQAAAITGQTHPSPIPSADNRGDIVGILSCESGELFMRYFKEYLEEMFAQYLRRFKFTRRRTLS